MGSVRFEELGERHCAILAKHYVEAYNAPPWNDGWTEALAEEKIGEMMDCRGAFGLVCHDETGAFTGAILGNAETFFDCKQFFIKDFFVPPAQQGKGIGSLLMTELEKRLAAMGISRVYLFTSKGELTEGFYQRRGYDTWHKMVLMGKDL